MWMKEISLIKREKKTGRSFSFLFDSSSSVQYLHIILEYSKIKEWIKAYYIVEKQETTVVEIFFLLLSMCIQSET